MEKTNNSAATPSAALNEVVEPEHLPGKAYFIRHGESTSNERNIFAGVLDVDLSSFIGTVGRESLSVGYFVQDVINHRSTGTAGYIDHCQKQGFSLIHQHSSKTSKKPRPKSAGRDRRVIKGVQCPLNYHIDYVFHTEDGRM